MRLEESGKVRNLEAVVLALSNEHWVENFREVTEVLSRIVGRSFTVEILYLFTLIRKILDQPKDFK